jgi:hypothetical protein
MAMCNADAISVSVPSRLSSASSTFGGSGKALRWQLPPRSHIRHRGQREEAAPIRAAKVRTLPGMTDRTGRCKCCGCTTCPLTVVPASMFAPMVFLCFYQHLFLEPQPPLVPLVRHKLIRVCQATQDARAAHVCESECLDVRFRASKG